MGGIAVPHRSQNHMSRTLLVFGSKTFRITVPDNVTYFVEQLDSAGVSSDRYRVIFKPTVILPDIEVR
jgi:hypothetical protein